MKLELKGLSKILGSQETTAADTSDQLKKHFRRRTMIHKLCLQLCKLLRRFQLNNNLKLPKLWNL